MIEKKNFFPIGIGTYRLNLDERTKTLDIKKLNEFQDKRFNSVKIDWSETGDGVLIDQLANKF